MTDGATTIRDIAALAGVSAGTVSRVMNGKTGVGSATRDRVQAIITEHNFHGDQVARRLSTGRSDCIGIVFPLHVREVVMHPVYPELLGSIADAAQAAGHDVMLFTSRGDGDVDHIVDAVRRKRVDGLILPAAGADDPLLVALEHAPVPLVLIGHRLRRERTTWVDTAHDTAVEELVDHLLQQGRRSFLLLNGAPRISAYALRAEGFRTAISAGGVHGSVLEVPMTMSAGLAAASGLDPGDVDAVICSADTVALGVLSGLASRRIAVPDRVAVTGFDDSPESSTSSPPLTTVRMPLDEVGQHAVRTLVRMLQHEGEIPAPTILPAQVHYRASA